MCYRFCLAGLINKQNWNYRWPSIKPPLSNKPPFPPPHSPLSPPLHPYSSNLDGSEDDQITCTKHGPCQSLLPKSQAFHQEEEETDPFEYTSVSEEDIAQEDVAHLTLDEDDEVEILDNDIESWPCFVYSVSNNSISLTVVLFRLSSYHLQLLYLINFKEKSVNIRGVFQRFSLVTCVR